MNIQDRTFKDNTLLILKGLAMGAANKVPGVSGGVVAFVAGFYEEFLNSLQRFNLVALKLLVTFRFRSFFQYVNGQFLSYLILGMLISYFSVSKLLDFLLVHYEIQVWAWFFGMIIGSIIYLVKEYHNWNRKHILFLMMGTSIGIALSLLNPAKENDNLWFVFFCGIIGVSGMTLPGLSGSFILILLGNYVLLLVDSVNALFEVLKNLFTGDFSFLNDQEQLRLLTVLVVFTTGSLVGLIVLSHILGFVIKTYKNKTFALIIGFITGSLGVVWPWKLKVFKTDANGETLMSNKNKPILNNYERYIPDFGAPETYWAMFAIGIGIITVLALEIYGKNRTKNVAQKNQKTI